MINKDTIFYRGKRSVPFDPSAAEINVEDSSILLDKLKLAYKLIRYFFRFLAGQRNPRFITYSREGQLKQHAFNCGIWFNFAKTLLFLIFCFTGCLFKAFSKADNIPNPTALKADTAQIRLLLQPFISQDERIPRDKIKVIDGDKGLVRIEDNGKFVAYTDSIIIYCGNIPDLEKSLAYSFATLKLFEQLKLENEIALTLNTIGNAYFDIRDIFQSERYYQKSLDIHKHLNDPQREALVYGNIGNVYSYRGDYNKALTAYLKGLKILKPEKDSVSLSQAYNNIGILYCNIGDFDKGKSFFIESLGFSKSLALEEQSGVVANLGELYEELDSKDSAIYYYNRALSLNEASGDILGAILPLNGLSRICAQQKKYKRALQMNLNTIQILNQYDYKPYAYISFATRGAIYLEQEKYDSSEFFLKKALEIITKNGSIKGIIQVNEALSELYTAQRRDDLALSHYKKSVLAHDSLLGLEKIKEFAQIESRYQYDLQQEELKREELQTQLKLDRKNGTIFLFAGTTLASFLIACIIFIMYRNSKLKNQKNVLVLEQKMLQNQMRPHFIYNALGMIQAFIQNDKPEEATHYLTKFSRLLRSVLENSRSEFVSLEKEIRTIEHYLEIHKPLFDNGFSYTIEANVPFSRSQLLIPPMLVQPFVENAIKHGLLQKDKKGRIHIRFSMHDDKVLFEITDNGIGLEKAEELKKTHTPEHASLSKIITEERLHRLGKRKNNHIQFSNIIHGNGETGTKVAFEIPYRILKT